MVRVAIVQHLGSEYQFFLRIITIILINSTNEIPEQYNCIDEVPSSAILVMNMKKLFVAKAMYKASVNL